MIKKVIIACLLLISFAQVQSSAVIFADYQASYKDAVVEMVLQDLPAMCIGYAKYLAEGKSPEDIAADFKLPIEWSLDSSATHKKVFLQDESIVGLLDFVIFKEVSLEEIRIGLVQAGQPYDEASLLQALPRIKNTAVECLYCAKINQITVARSIRGKGYGKKFLQHLYDTLSAQLPYVKKVSLDASKTNAAACAFYESMGFKASEVQPAYLVELDAIEYEKFLQ